MKTKFRFLFTLLITIGTIGFAASCSSDDNGNGIAPETEKTVTVAVNIAGASNTRAVEGSALNLTPDLNDLKLFFSDGANILSIQSATNLTDIKDATKGETFRVPSGVTKVHAIGNSASIAVTGLSNITIGSTVATLEGVMFDMDEQTHPKTGVNVKGNSTTAFSVVAGGEETSFDLVAAVARIEIKSVKSVKETGVVSNNLTSFTLEDIFINNTYSKFPYGGALPAAVANEVKYGKDVSIFTAWTDGTSYPDFFTDKVAAASTSATVTPATANNVWGYYVPATIANDATPVATKPGTIIDGTQYDAVPHVILKISNVVAAGYGTSAADLAKIYYVTIRGFNTVASSTKVTNLLAGNFYIMDINFGAEHLSTNPEDPTKSLKVKVSVQPWEKVEVKPIL